MYTSRVDISFTIEITPFLTTMHHNLGVHLKLMRPELARLMFKHCVEGYLISPQVNLLRLHFLSLKQMITIADLQ